MAIMTMRLHAFSAGLMANIGRITGQAARVLALALVAMSLPALAGEADFEVDDIHEHGAPYFGDAKEIKAMTPLEGVRFKIQLKGALRFFIITTDDDGRFRRNGLGLDVDPEQVEVTCEKDGFRTVDVLRRRTSRAKNAPVEVECLLERN
jgi:hypothetical protein